MLTLDHAWDSLVTMTLQSVLVCLLAGVGVVLLRKSAAASRHLLLALSVSALLAAPLFALFLPHRQVILYPQASSPSRNAAARTALPAREPALPPGSGARLLPPEAPAAFAPVMRAARTSPFRETVAMRAEQSSSPNPSVPTREARHAPIPPWQTAPGKQAVLVVWLLGAAIVLSRLPVGLIGARRVLSRETVADPLLSQAVTQSQRELGIERTVAVRRTRAGSALPAPLTWGFFRPMLLLPGEFLEWSQERRRMVLLHELAHVQRADWLVQLLVQTVRALYWFHPLVWWTTRRLQAESERACDDTVLLTGVAPSAYAETLLEVIRIMHRSKTSVLSPTSMLSMARPPIEARVQAILSPRQRQRPSRLLTLLASAGTAVCAVLLASVQVKAGQTPASTARSSHIPGVAGESALPPRAFVSPSETPATNLRLAPEQTVVSARVLKSQQSEDGDEVAMLRKKLDALELLLVQNQEENAKLRQQIKTLEAMNDGTARLNKALGDSHGPMDTTRNSDTREHADSLRLLAANRNAADMNMALGAENQRSNDSATKTGITLRPIKGTGIRIDPDSLITISVPQSLQMVLRDLQHQQASLQTTGQQTEELERKGFVSASNARDAKAKLAACKLQVHAVQKAIAIEKAKRHLSQKEGEFVTICLQIAGFQSALLREQERLTAMRARFQASAAGKNDLSNAELMVTQLQAHLEEAKAKLSQASTH